MENNKLLASKIASVLGISDESIERGLKNTFLPCRFEIIKRSPFVILDGAHNEVKIESVVHNLKNLKFKKLFLILGFSEGKDSESMLKLLVPLADHVFFSRFQILDRKSLSPLLLHQQSKKYKKRRAIFEIRLDPFLALETALKKAGKDDVILVTGSFYLVGELRTKWFPESFILKNRASH